MMKLFEFQCDSVHGKMATVAVYGTSVTHAWERVKYLADDPNASYYDFEESPNPKYFCLIRYETD